VRPFPFPRATPSRNNASRARLHRKLGGNGTKQRVYSTPFAETADGRAKGWRRIGAGGGELSAGEYLPRIGVPKNCLNAPAALSGGILAAAAASTGVYTLVHMYSRAARLGRLSRSALSARKQMPSPFLGSVVRFTFRLLRLHSAARLNIPRKNRPPPPRLTPPRGTTRRTAGGGWRDAQRRLRGDAAASGLALCIIQW